MLFQIPAQESIDFVREINPADWMAKGKTSDWYFTRGYEALALIIYECKRFGLSPKRILDFGCGHGNVARMLAAWFRNSNVIGQDVNPDWLSWVEQTIGIETRVSPEHIQDVDLDRGEFDLIWVGSVFTHIPAASSIHLLERFKRGLSEQGLLIFTCAGQAVFETFRPGHEPFLDEASALTASRDFIFDGYGFASYQNGRYPDWGRALVRFDWMFERLRTAGFTLNGFHARGWGRQDVYSVGADGSRV